MTNNFFKNLAESQYQKAADGIVSVKSKEDENKVRSKLEVVELIDDSNVSEKSINLSKSMKKDTSLPTTTVTEGSQDAAAVGIDEMYDLADEIIDLIDSFYSKDYISHTMVCQVRTKLMEARDTLLMGSPDSVEAVTSESLEESETSELNGILSILKREGKKK